MVVLEDLDYVDDIVMQSIQLKVALDKINSLNKTAGERRQNKWENGESTEPITKKLQEFMYPGSLVTTEGGTEKDMKNTHQRKSSIHQAKRN